MLKKILLYSSGVFLLVVAYQLFFGPTGARDLVREAVTLDTIRSGKFEETIPFNGRMIQEEASRKVIAEIDELYWPRMSAGLKASSTINGVDYSFVVTRIDTLVHGGRFNIILSSADSVLQQLEMDSNLRMRLCFSEAVNAILLPVGGFYNDSGGKYVYVVLSDGKVVKRDVLLGPHNTECFQVLDGLVAGDVVITSSYEYFKDRDDLDLETIRELYD